MNFTFRIIKQKGFHFTLDLVPVPFSQLPQITREHDQDKPFYSLNSIECRKWSLFN